MAIVIAIAITIKLTITKIITMLISIMITIATTTKILLVGFFTKAPITVISLKIGVLQ